MKLVRLKGNIIHILGEEATVQPDDGSAQIAVPLNAFVKPAEGDRVDMMIVPPRNPGGLAKIVTRSKMGRGFGTAGKNMARASKIESWTSLKRAILKARERVEAMIREEKARQDSENGDETSNADLSGLEEKLAWLEKGLNMFRG
ncbi:MAG: hypothetical protein HQM09_07985 [Candidatus Riflebacteria bacterium]|nr:hypothetical protein [Candidatus Riflebacteria bacterium]